VLVPIGLWLAGTAYLFVLLGAYLRREALRRNMRSLPWRLARPQVRFGDRRLIAELQPLRRLARAAVRSLDIEATVHATAAAGGLLRPHFRQTLIGREFVVLIDRQSRHDHVAEIAHLVVRAFLDANVAIAQFEFAHDPALCRGMRGGETVPLTQLVRSFSDSVFLIFASPDQLFDPVTGEHSTAAATLSQAGMVILLTPSSAGPDAPAARRLATKLGIRSYPMSAEGLRRLSAHLVGSEPHGMSRSADVAPEPHPETALFEFLERRPERWMQRAAPSRQDRSRLRQLLRNALGERAFAWLAATSLFPELRWPLTLSLKSKLQPSDTAGEADPALRTVARLPWFRRGWMPEWVRKALVDSLDPSYRSDVRQAIVAAIDPSKGSAAGELMSVHVDHEGSPSPRDSVRSDRILLDYLLPLLPSDRGWFEVPRGWVASMVQWPLLRLGMISSLGLLLAAFLSVSTLAILPIDECDLYASSAADPLRIGPPIHNDVMREVGSRATTACRSSVERIPSNPRFQYQYYRSLMERRIISEQDREIAQKALAYAESMAYPVAYIGRGYTYHYGEFGTVDHDKAKKFYALAVEKGAINGLVNLAEMYEDEDEYKKAYELRRQYESQGGIYLFGLARMYRDGIFVEADRKQYRETIVECVRRQGPTCFDELGYIYQSGEFGEVDYNTVINLYERALQYGGSAYAAYQLAELYFSGEGMDEPDLNRATYYAVFAKRLEDTYDQLYSDPVALLCEIVGRGEIVWPEGVRPPRFCPMQSNEGSDASATN
jgi:hypothetical protein